MHNESYNRKIKNNENNLDYVHTIRFFSYWCNLEDYYI